MTTENENGSAALMDAESVGRKSRAGKYLTFNLGDEEYGLEILKVYQIIGLMNITPVPQTPHFVKGVINLRGTIIPVIDIRLKFGMMEIESTDKTCIIVLEVENNKESVQLGIIVDSVSEVLDISENEIEDAPSFGSDLDSAFILGMAKTKDSVKILLNIDRVMTGYDLQSFM
jgi:purine-binding chemotaxis protein CheW